MLLDKKASVWRKVLQSNGFSQDTQIYGSIDCSIVPTSKLDTDTPYAYESTHLVYVPFWLLLEKEDQVRYGRRLINAASNNVEPWIYVINGRAPFSQGVPQILYYARERD